ncbi:hypothetical protein [Tenacibaculum sp. M341]|uniref:hypothetical protein n=1 Tax=Tenacibaculum sp. M341 TaxID=2530339 RepID=UPI0010502743|nr:hypothetical protein [Tenacibaculum sp. M341]TCI94227.1 hypothetical protein EYW44_02465 [Tenacibaculum sp. M341]
MKKSILNLGKSLSRKEQKEINGSRHYYPACKCDDFGNKINEPCEGGYEHTIPPLPDICDVFPDICN